MEFLSGNSNEANILRDNIVFKIGKVFIIFKHDNSQHIFSTYAEPRWSTSWELQVNEDDQLLLQ